MVKKFKVITFSAWVILALFCTTNASSADLNQGLIAHYPFDGNVEDRSLYNRHGMLEGNPVFVEGVNGEAISISLHNYVRVKQGFVPGVGSYSFSVFYYVPAETNNIYNPHFVTTQGGDFKEGTIFRIVKAIDNSQHRFNLVMQPGAYYGDQKIFFDADEYVGSWHHAVAVVDRERNIASIYIDSIKVHEENITVSGSIDPSMDMLIGAYDYITARNGNPRVVSGDVVLDELRIYNRVLAEEEITELYSGDNLPLKIGLVAHYPLDGDAKDLSGNNHHGAEHGNLSYSNGVLGNAAIFDGIDDKITISSLWNNGVSNIPKTISMWIKADDDNRKTMTFISQWTGCFDYNDHFFIGAYGEDLSYLGLRTEVRDQSFIFQDRSVVMNGGWHHIVLTYDGTNGAQYVDNVKNAEERQTNIINSPYQEVDLTIGALSTDVCGYGNTQMKGLIDEVRIYNRALSDAEIQELYSYGKSVGTAPLADAGHDQSVHPGDLVILDGSGSSDQDENYPLTYSWKLVARPEKSTAELSGADTSAPSFVADEPGDYKVELVVTDSGGLASAPDEVFISTCNAPPIAEAGDDQAVIVLGSTVTLDARQSYDPEGDSLEYFWTLASKPAESVATLNDPSSSTPSFVADVQGQYVFELVVADPWAMSEPDTVAASFTNVKPVADAGDNQSVVQGQSVSLDGSGSYDANGDSLTYSWNLVSRAENSLAEIGNAGSANASLYVDQSGEYIASLVVNDGFVNSEANNVTVMVISKQDATTQALQDVLEASNDLESSVFKNKNLQKTLTNKVSAALKLVDEGAYYEALEKLNNDVFEKMNGCADSGTPDKNDWIKDCAAQEAVNLPLQNAIDLLWGM